jgi:hypothetical protein
VQLEIDWERQTEIRQLIKDAYLQVSDNFGEYDTIINFEQDSCSEWHTRIDRLQNQIVDKEAFGSDIELITTPKAVSSAKKYLERIKP